MATRQIDLNFGVSAFDFNVDLDNRPFTFTFKFNDRLDRWSFNILDDAGTELITGVPLFVNQLLLGKFKHDLRLPQGDLFAINLVSADAPPVVDTLGTDVILLYEEVAA